MNRVEGERQDAFSALLAQNEKLLYKVAHAYCRSTAEREELIAEIIAALWKSFGRFDARYRFSTWAYRIALNVAISFRRSETRRASRRAAIDAAAGEFAVDEDVPDERVVRLGEFIAALGEIDKALMLLYLDEFDYASIAAILGLTETNVATKLSRLRAKAKAALADGAANPTGENRGIR